VTLTSSSPDVVSINPDGALVAHRLGSATIRSIPNPASVLLVEVREIRDLRIEPAEIRMRIGESAVAHLIAGGKPMDGTVAEWSTDDLAIARADGAIIRAAVRPGRTTLRARIGDAEATGAVLVENGTALQLRAPRALRSGQIGHAELAPPPLERVEWTSSRPNALKSIGGGFFEALTKGRVEVCARFSKETRCSTVEVTR